MCHHPSEAHAIGPVSGGSGTTDRSFEIATTDTRLPIFEAAPDGESRGTVIIIHDIWGATPFYQNLARRYAGVGYTTLLPDLFVRQGGLSVQSREAAFARREHFSEPQAIVDLQRVVDEVAGRGGKMATVGFCMGGTLVMLLAARETRVAAGVIYYGFPANPKRTDLRPYEPLGEAALVNSPLLGFWGDEDHGVGMDNVERYRGNLTAAGKSFDFTIYPGAPHGFLAFDGSKPYLAESNDSWEKTLAFFGEYLDGPAA